MTYLKEIGIMTERQLEFRNGRSCVSNLLSLYSRVIDMLQEKDSLVDCVYLDLVKAFDKVTHKLLIGKLKHSGGQKGSLLE